MLDRIWFGISDLYTIKRYMRLSDMQLTDFVCIASLSNFFSKSASYSISKSLVKHFCHAHTSATYKVTVADLSLGICGKCFAW